LIDSPGIGKPAAPRYCEISWSWLIRLFSEISRGLKRRERMYHVFLWNFKGYSLAEQGQSLDRVYSLLIRLREEKKETANPGNLGREPGEAVKEMLWNGAIIRESL
jgi:hypothetical protein